MTLRYICDLCDLRAESNLGHHVCEAPDDETLNSLIVQATRARTYIDERCIHGAGYFTWRFRELEMDISRLAIPRGYRWSLTQVGDGTEYRARFEHGLGNTVASVLDTDPARAVARGFLRIPKESEGGA
jgi:hypothetical protein